MSDTTTGSTSASSETMMDWFKMQFPMDSQCYAGLLRCRRPADQRHKIMAGMRSDAPDPAQAQSVRRREYNERLENRSGRGLAERGDDVIDHFLDQDAVVALTHHANHRLGARRADQQPAVAVEPLFAGDDCRLDLGVVERLAAAVAHVLEDLRQRIEAMADLRHRAAKFLHHREHLQCRDKTVA